MLAISPDIASFRDRGAKAQRWAPSLLGSAPRSLDERGEKGQPFGYMRARWATFGVGLWLILAPLVLGYANVLSVLHDVALGLLMAVGGLAALEWPLARFGLVLPAAWLLAAPQAMGWASTAVAANERACGVVMILLALVPSRRIATAQATAKMAA
jgi:hypothetical protein